MASKTPLALVFNPAAARDLSAIWEYNADHRGVDVADSYEAFLKNRLNALAETPALGRTVRADPDFRYLVMRKRPKSDGHVAGYRIDVAAQTVRILRIYHTKQDWQTYLENEGA